MLRHRKGTTREDRTRFPKLLVTELQYNQPCMMTCLGMCKGVGPDNYLVCLLYDINSFYGIAGNVAVQTILANSEHRSGVCQYNFKFDIV